jgi:hypothetical protein
VAAAAQGGISSLSSPFVDGRLHIVVPSGAWSVHSHWRVWVEGLLSQHCACILCR